MIETLIPLTWGILYRIPRGGPSKEWFQKHFRGWGGPGSGINRGISALLCATAAALVTGNPWLIGLALILHASWGVGHGSYMRPGERTEPDNERWVRPVLQAIGLRDGSTLYDVVGMSVTGLMVTFPMAGYMWLCGYTGLSFWIGAGKGPIYWLFHRLRIRQHTVYAELATGALYGLAVVAERYAVT